MLVTVSLMLVSVVALLWQHKPPSDVIMMDIASKDRPKQAVTEKLPTKGLRITKLTGSTTIDLREHKKNNQTPRRRKSKNPKDLKGLVVNVNTATEEQLKQLPGVGKKTARRIMVYRKTKGRFKSLDDLDAVKGLGPKTLEKMRLYVRF